MNLRRNKQEVIIDFLDTIIKLYAEHKEIVMCLKKAIIALQVGEIYTCQEILRVVMKKNSNFNVDPWLFLMIDEAIRVLDDT